VRAGGSGQAVGERVHAARFWQRLPTDSGDRVRGTAGGPPSEQAHDADAELVRALRAGDERAFATLLEKYGPSLLRLAQLYVSSRAVAEEVVQETWLAVLTGIERFEGRSSLKTWLFRILTNKAKTRGQREARTVPFSSLAADGDEDEAAVDVDRFAGPDSRYAGHWAAPPRAVPEERLLAAEARERIEEAIAALPPNQRLVITLRDVEGLSADEARNVLGVSETNQRVLLHRARAKVRAAFERYLEETA
jgi:RNA polymerase sigma-70 factor (ECF subfamily)